MRNLKIESQGLQTFVVYALESDDVMDIVTYKMLRVQTIKGILPVFLATEEKSKYLKYNISSRLNLKQFIQRNLECFDYLNAARNLVTALRECEAYSLHKKGFVMDSQYVYVKEATEEVEFIYLPIERQEADASVRPILEELIEGIKPFDEVTKRDKEKLMETLRREDFKLEDFHSQLDQILTHTKRSRQLILNRKTSEDIDFTHAPQPEPVQSDWEGPRTETIPCAYLERVRTGERVLVDQMVFKIGKAREFVDYCITDNPTISRSHANIVLEGKDYYIQDINSKNHTYVNGKVLKSGDREKIIPGSQILLSDEEFIFKM